MRSFFRDIKTVRDNGHKVTFYEKESDIKFSALARRIFDSELPLDQKMHLRYFVEKIDRICDQAEDGIRDRSPSRGLGDVYKRQTVSVKSIKS